MISRRDSKAAADRITVPPALVEETVQREGEPGRSWLRALPDLVVGYLDQWKCAVDGPPVNGAVAIVVPVRRAGSPAVLKISFPHPGNVSEPFALVAWNGRGAVRLLERDDDHFVMLLERASATTLASVTDNDTALAVAGGLARRLAVPGPGHLPWLTDTVPDWRSQLETQDRELAGPLPRRIVQRALEAIDDLASDTTTTLVHGDLHYANVLQAWRGADTWLAIDPKGYHGSAAFDAATCVWERLEEVVAGEARPLVRRRVSIFAEAAGVDAELAWRCTLARSVSAFQWLTLHSRGERAAQCERLIVEGMA